MSDEQPAPVPTAGRPIWELVIEDMRARDRLGRQRYGTPLQAHNGRDALVDAYQEALDLAVYLRQAIEERDRPVAAPHVFTALGRDDLQTCKCGRAYTDPIHIPDEPGTSGSIFTRPGK